MLVFPGRNDERLTGFEDVMDNANAAFGEMVEAGEIRGEKRERRVLAAYPRSKDELFAPFEAGGQFRGLRVEHYEFLSLLDAAWADYERDHDVRALVTKHAMFFRAVFVPSLASALDRVRAGDSAALHAFADRLRERIMRRLAGKPAPTHTFVQTMVVAKGD